MSFFDPFCYRCVSSVRSVHSSTQEGFWSSSSTISSLNQFVLEF
eukprot:UN15567